MLDATRYQNLMNLKGTFHNIIHIYTHYMCVYIMIQIQWEYVINLFFLHGNDNLLLISVREMLA